MTVVILRWTCIALLIVGVLRWAFFGKTRRDKVEVIQTVVGTGWGIGFTLLPDGQPRGVLAIGLGAILSLSLIQWTSRRWVASEPSAPEPSGNEECACPDCECTREGTLLLDTPMGQQKICTECAAGRHVISKR
jgi:hypothetical protein